MTNQIETETKNVELIFLEDVFVSTKIINSYFQCDLSKCLGSCCLHGDVGAPLDQEEVHKIQKNLDKIMPYLDVKNLIYLETFGFRSKDDEQNDVTACLNGKDCVFSFKKNRIYHCAIRKAFEEEEIDFPKPISCTLYPIREHIFQNRPALILDRWDICQPASELGKRNSSRVFQFCKQGLIQRFGKTWFEKLQQITENL